MAAGFQPTLTGVNNQAANVAVGVRNALQQANIYQTWLLSFGTPALQTLGMSAGDAATLGSAFTDLNDLWNIYNGAASTHLTGTYDYRQFAKQLAGYI